MNTSSCRERSLDTKYGILAIEILNKLGGLISRKISGACSVFKILLNVDCIWPFEATKTKPRREDIALRVVLRAAVHS